MKNRKVKRDIVGRRFGRLEVLDNYKIVNNRTHWLVLCDCGNEKYVYRYGLISGNTQSCGCISATQNGLSNHRLYRIWWKMKERCYSKNDIAYDNYGGKGIYICDEWQDFLTFYEWAMANGYKDNLSIDRVDSDDIYKASNCRWITKSENTTRANKGTHKRKSEFIYYGLSPCGTRYEFANASQFCREHNLNNNGVRRVARGERDAYKGWKFGFTDIPNL